MGLGEAWFSYVILPSEGEGKTASYVDSNWGGKGEAEIAGFSWAGRLVLKKAANFEGSRNTQRGGFF